MLHPWDVIAFTVCVKGRVIRKSEMGNHNLLFNAIAALIVVAATVVAAVFGFAFLAERLAVIDRSVATILVVTAVSVLLAARIIGNAQVRAQRLRYQHQCQTARKELYLRLLDSLSSERYRSPSNASPPQYRITDLLAVERELLLKGSPGVINLYAKLRTHTPIASADPGTVTQHLLLEMRTDLGERSDGLNPADTLGLGRDRD